MNEEKLKELETAVKYYEHGELALRDTIQRQAREIHKLRNQVIELREELETVRKWQALGEELEQVFETHKVRC